jgi:deazaflavin-dependent oxidoreductase (nitroreductase family)
LLGRYLLLLTTRGRKSGRPRTIAIHYQRHGDTYLICASNAGRPGNPAWVHNLRADPEVIVQVGPRRFACRADEPVGEEKERLWNEWIARDPGYQRMSRRVGRGFPLVRLRPGEIG